MNKTYLYILTMTIVAILLLPLISASEDFAEAKQLIASGASCKELTSEQLELMGDYYMEQMHPGEAHELMDNMMGGEGSESLKLVHINMAKRIYCKENIYIGYGMMAGNEMMGQGRQGMMQRGIINNDYGYGYGMMGSYNSGYNFIDFLYSLLLIGLLVLIILWIVKSLKGMKNTGSTSSISKRRKK